MKRAWFLVALLGAVVMGCGDKPTPTDFSAPPPASRERMLKLAFVTNNAAAYWNKAKAGCDEAQLELPNIHVDFRIPSETSAAGQKQILDDLLASGTDGIAISPIDPTNQTSTLNDAARQTLIVTQDSDAPNSDRAFYLGSDNFAAGKQAGELIKKALPDGGKIMVFVGNADAQNAADRLGGIKSVLDGTKVQILDVRTDGADYTKAKANAQDTLVKYPDIAALVGLYNYNGPQILSAVREANKTGSVKIICFDDEAETLAGVKSGEIYGTVAQLPFEIGRQSVIDMVHYLRGDKSFIPADKKIIIPTVAVQKDNIDDFISKYEPPQ